MRTSVALIKQTGVTCAEFAITLVTLVVLNAVIILPVARFIAEIFHVIG